MAKYRNLTNKELETFEKEFVDYLVVNGIVAEDWEKMKREDAAKAEKIIDLFSDVILEGVMRKVKFLEIRTKAYIQAVQCLADKMVMVAISCKDKSVDMRELDSVDTTPKALTAFEMHQGEKKYQKQREIELYEMVTGGYEVSDGQLFKQLILVAV